MTIDIVSSGQTVRAQTLASGDILYVLSGGNAVGIEVSPGANLTVFAGGTATDTIGEPAIVGTIPPFGPPIVVERTLLGAVTVLSGGLAVGTSGGVYVYSGGSAVGTVLNSGATADINGAATDTVVNLGGTVFVAPGGRLDGAVVNDGGLVQIQRGSAGDLILLSGGLAVISSAGTLSGATVFAGGTDVIYGGGVAEATVLSAGTETIYPGGIASGTIVSSGGFAAVSGGTARATKLRDGGEAIVTGDGNAIATSVSSGAFLLLQPGNGVAWVQNQGGTVISAGVAVLSGHAVLAAVPGTIAGGESAWVLPGGSVTGTLIEAGGSVVVYAGGTAQAAQVSAGGTLDIASGGSASGATILSGGAEILAAGGAANGTVLQPGGVLDLPWLPYDSADVVEVNQGTGLLSIITGERLIGVEELSGSYTSAYFNIALDGVGGTRITLDGTPCFCRGTMIQTEHGERPVEALRIGERLLTHAGAIRPIVWIGRRRYSARFAAGNPAIRPVLIRTGALDGLLPRRDLFVSPSHALYIDGVLIEAADLINGLSILQVETGEEIEYFHLELECHDVILAEGAPAESFVDDGSRGMFHNAAEYRLLYPAAPRQQMRACAPRVAEGEALEVVRRRLRSRAAPPAAGKLFGFVDRVERDRIFGWARDDASPVRLRISDNDVVIGEVVADGHRPDVFDNGLGGPQHGFDFVIPGGLTASGPHVIAVQRAADGAHLQNSPWTLAAETGTLAAETASLITGHLDQVSRHGVTGWAHDTAAPDRAVEVALHDNGALLISLPANRYREDLKQAGIGDGCRSFDIRFPGGLSAHQPHVLELRDARSGEPIAPPAVIEASPRFDADMQAAISAAIEAAVTPQERRRILAFLAGQIERLERGAAPRRQRPRS